MHRGRVTIKDIARIAGVSISTVSAALNDKPGVGGRTRARILEIARAHRYRPHHAARSLKTRKTKTLGLIAPVEGTGASVYFTSVVRGMLGALSGSDFKLHLIKVERGWIREGCGREIESEGALDGLLIMIPNVSELPILEREFENLPFVVVGASTDEARLHFVDSDNRRGAALATEHLIHLGHRRIGFVYDDLDNANTFARYLGYKDALKKHGIEFDDSLVVSSKAEGSPGVGNIDDLIDRRPTSIFVFEDFTAFRVINRLRERGLRVPEDIAVVGFDNERGSQFFQPPLTTVEQPLHEMGERAVMNLIEIIGEKPRGYLQELLRTKLIVRESCGVNLRPR
ncbi:MAG: LacI family DNA-binding transcriptional regulator [bacterium]